MVILGDCEGVTDSGLQDEADKTGGMQPTKPEHLADVTTRSDDPQPTLGQLSPAQSCLKVRVCLPLVIPKDSCVKQQ